MASSDNRDPNHREAKPGANAAFQSVIDSVPGAWYIVRRNGSFAYVNLGACASLGFTREELLALTIFDVDPRLEHDGWEMLWDSTKPSDSVTLRTVHRRRDGQDYPVEVRASRIWLDGEDVAASFSIDLTVSEQTRAALLATEAKLERLLKHLPDLVFRIRFAPQPSFEFVSSSVSSLLGYLPDELLEQPELVSAIVYPEDMPELLALGTGARQVSRPLRFVHKRGETVWLELRASLLADLEGGKVLEGVARDVTKSYLAESASRRLRIAIEQVGESVVVTDALGCVEYVNPAYEHSTGQPADAVQGLPWAQLEVRTDGAFLRRIERALVAGKPWKGRVVCLHVDGRRFDEEVTLTPLRSDADEVIGCIAVKRDVTEQLRLEEQLRHAEKMNAVGQLAGGIAHDFNNLLHVIQGNAEMARVVAESGLPLEPVFREITHATQRASALVNQLLTFSSKGAVDFSVHRLDQIVESLLEMLGRLLGEQVYVRWSCEVNEPCVRGNRAQLEQVVANLCINARDAMPKGGTLDLRLTSVPRAALPLVLTKNPEREFLQLTVTDEGEGIRPELLSHLFEPFFTTKPAGKGTGLGLATAYAVAESHDGAITVSSEPGKGAQFRVYLPLAQAAEEVEVASPQLASEPAPGKTILVAEDEPAVRRLTCLYLQTCGYHVVPAADGQEAQAELERLRGEVVAAVLDAVMPHRSGQEVYEWLRQQNWQLPVVFVTGYDYQSLVLHEGDSAVTVLSKPFNRERLQQEVVRLVRQAETSKAAQAARAP